MYEELAALIEEEKATLKAIKEQEAEAQRLAQEEHRYWKEYTKYRKDYLNTDDEYRRYDFSYINHIGMYVILILIFLVWSAN